MTDKAVVSIKNTIEKYGLNNDGGELSQQSKKNYISYYTKLYKHIETIKDRKPKNVLSFIIKNPEKIIEIIQGFSTSKNSQKLYISSIQAYFRATLSRKEKMKKQYKQSTYNLIKETRAKYSAYSLKLKQEIEKDRGQNIKTEEEKNEWENWETLHQKVNKYIEEKLDVMEKTNLEEIKGKDKKKRVAGSMIKPIQLLLTVSLYVNGKYLPRLDYANLKITDDIKSCVDENCFIVKDNTYKIKINHFNKVKWEPITFDVSKPTIRLYKMWERIVKVRPELNNKALLVKVRGKGVMTNKQLGKRLTASLKSITGKHITLNLLRKIKSTNIKKNATNYNEEKEQHNSLIHSFKEGQLYNKNDNDNSKETALEKENKLLKKQMEDMRKEIQELKEIRKKYINKNIKKRKNKKST